MNGESQTHDPRSKILVIDDDKMIVHAVKNTLEKLKYNVATAGDGEEGLAKLRLQKPDLIILDVMMPRMDGWTFIRRLRSTPQNSLIPVIFLTALQESENKLKGFQLGADDYITKPFRVEELEFRIKNVLKRFKKITDTFKPVASEEKTAPGFNGQLEQLGLATLLTIFQMEQKTGLLMLIDTVNMETARLFVRGGKVICARIDNKIAVKNEEAIYDLLSWKSGQFVFKTQTIEGDEEIHCSITDLLLEGARRMDEAQR